MGDAENAENAVADAFDDYARCPCVEHADLLDDAIIDLTRARVR